MNTLPQPACIWVDADAAPKAIRDILCKAAVRTQVHIWFVANHTLPLPKSEWIHSRTVAAGFDVADNSIVQSARPGDLLITQDIPLAAEIMELGVDAMNPRGEPYSRETIRQRLNMRDFMETMRSSGIQSGGPSAFDQRDKQSFANSLDRWLAKQKKMVRPQS
ncbi:MULTISPECIES: YaiI/YqxD family protein [unclassified Oceanobacter]|uniref:YaiI/YqxD family protein n=1 Tax=unclassified Oceanobacter TaxID=2620260 RepID=UPI0027332F78|nr:MULTISPECIES: YaiI/YqxD family protein [unclassified Oceanobacter]MDP2506488.1 YaiI/YqxD family protein [Oceanobacter sp. 3_MG-2023]MDP2548866.1 YaiI/YqxD family protein [Oceanobacter sp. 4_MG-2023]